jgi:hypothetical protein
MKELCSYVHASQFNDNAMKVSTADLSDTLFSMNLTPDWGKDFIVIYTAEKLLRF